MRKYLRILIVSLSCYILGGCSNFASRSKLDGDQIKRPVVSIRSIQKENRIEEKGAGFIVGKSQSELYIVTAKHVIVNPDSIFISFISGEENRAELVQSNNELDLAVLKINIGNMRIDPSFSFFPNTDELVMEQAITMVGHPLGNLWDINFRNAVKETEIPLDDRRFSITNDDIDAGSSGGPVLNKNHELIGMVYKVDRIKALCISIQTIQEALEQWYVPANLLTGDPGQIVIPITENPIKESLFQKSYNDPIAGEFVLVEGGSFQMGSKDGYSDEQPVHPVTVKDYYIGKFEVSVAQFSAFIKDEGYKTDAEKNGGSYFWNGNSWEIKPEINWRYDAAGKLRPREQFNHPVIHISWNDAKAYCKWLNMKTGKEYRLPSESEWEFAARGGSFSNNTTYAGSNDPNEVGWYGSNSDDKTHPVGEKDPNELGLHDMSGNVWEWCEDWYHDSYKGAPTDGSARLDPEGSLRVVRGGSWSNIPANLRVADRDRSFPDRRYYNIGFRLTRTAH